jgi:uncharacterized glyoxalase superfamily protein PhnB
MRLSSFYPVLFTDDIAASSAFYTTHFGFHETFRSDWYMSLIHSERKAYQLAIMQPTHDSIPEGFREHRSSLLLNFEVPDATSEYERLQAAGVRIVQPLRDEDWGQRHFIAVDPGGVLIDVIETIPPSPEFAAQYHLGEGVKG